MSPGRKVIEIICQCGLKIAKYEKQGRGKLLKMYLDKILEDKTGVFLKHLKTGQFVFCPSCKKRLATIQMVHGRPAAKMNQGTIKQIKT